MQLKIPGCQKNILNNCYGTTFKDLDGWVKLLYETTVMKGKATQGYYGSEWVNS